MFTLHLTFADGSNPWVRFNMTTEEFGKELVKWSKNYDLVYGMTFDTLNVNKGTGCTMCMTAVRRDKS